MLRLTAVALSVVVWSRALTAQRALVCGDLETRATLRRIVQTALIANDPGAVYRLALLRVPRVHPDSVIYVDDERLCERAARAYYRDRLGPRPLGGVSVARVGDMYVVLGENRGGEWLSLVVFNRDFEPVESVGI